MYGACRVLSIKSALNWGKYISAAEEAPIPGTAMNSISMPSMSSPDAVLLVLANSWYVDVHLQQP